ncbi:hypothetical protein ACJX0J_027712, partial [Zea mays]
WIRNQIHIKSNIKNQLKVLATIFILSVIMVFYLLINNESIQTRHNANCIITKLDIMQIALLKAAEVLRSILSFKDGREEILVGWTLDIFSDENHFQIQHPDFGHYLQPAHS